MTYFLIHDLPFIFPIRFMETDWNLWKLLNYKFRFYLPDIVVTLKAYWWISPHFLILSDLWLAHFIQLFWLELISKVTYLYWRISACHWVTLLGLTLTLAISFNVLVPSPSLALTISADLHCMNYTNWLNSGRNSAELNLTAQTTLKELIWLSALSLCVALLSPLSFQVILLRVCMSYL